MKKWFSSENCQDFFPVVRIFPAHFVVTGNYNASLFFPVFLITLMKRPLSLQSKDIICLNALSLEERFQELCFVYRTRFSFFFFFSFYKEETGYKILYNQCNQNTEYHILNYHNGFKKPKMSWLHNFISWCWVNHCPLVQGQPRYVGFFLILPSKQCHPQTRVTQCWML